MKMFSVMLTQPMHWVIWLFWLMTINMACLLFLRHKEARWVLAAWLGNVFFMTFLFEANGYNRLLGLSHVVWWTPLLIYLWKAREVWSGSGLFAKWIRVLFVTNLVSLVIDYVDVIRYLLGDRG